MLRMGEKYQVLATNTMTDRFSLRRRLPGVRCSLGANPSCFHSRKLTKNGVRKLLFGEQYAAVLVRACNGLNGDLCL